MRRLKGIRHRLDDDSGTDLTEFAIVAPLFIILIYWSQFFADLGVLKLKAEEAAFAQTLDDLRRLAGVVCPHDDLRVRQVRESVHGRCRCREDSRGREERCRDENQEAIGDRPPNESGNHLAPPIRCTDTNS